MSGNLSQYFGNDGFDPTKVEANLIPPGDHNYLIEQASVKQTKKGDGAYIEIVQSVTEGEHKGMKVWKRINIVNPNAKAQAIGQSQLKELVEAANLDSRLVDANQLVNRVVCGVTVVKDGFNEIKRYKPVKQFTQQQQNSYNPPQQNTNNPVSQTQSSGRPPWAQQ